jgi:hypothetical protein
MAKRKLPVFRIAPKQRMPTRALPRNYDSLMYRGKTPSSDFDWDAALYRYALMMRELGYRLTPEQQKRIDDHD